VTFEAIKWAYEQDGLSGPQKSVLLAIAFHYNSEVRCAWPSHGVLARETSLAKSTVQSALSVLEDGLGLVVSRERVDADGRQTSSVYFLPNFDPMSRPTRPSFGRAA
jgi:hypothetical protein